MIAKLFEQAIPSPGSHAGTTAERLDFWNAGIRMILANPLVGTGDADYKETYMKYRVEGATGEAYLGSHMHNDYINTTVLYGVGGLTLHLAFYLLPLSVYFRERNKLVSRENYW